MIWLCMTYTSDHTMADRWVPDHAALAGLGTGGGIEIFAGANL